MQAKWKSCTTPPTPATRGGSTRSPAEVRSETDQFGGTSAAYNRGALALAALRSTVGDAKFREIEKTWVQEHQEQFDRLV